MRSHITYSILAFLFITGCQLHAQTINKGNKHFSKKEYAKAEASYRETYSKNNSPESAYNLGNAIYKQGAETESKNHYIKAVESAQTKPEKHKAFHNLGNAFMKEKKYTEAVEAYKNALRNNPSDEETRYNYALAKELLKKNPPPPDQNDDNNQDQKQQDQDKDNQQDQDPKDNESKEDKKPEQNQDQNKPDESNNNQEQPKPQGISKETLQRLLEAVNNEEKKVQDKINAEKVKGQPVKTDKDW